MEKLRKNIPFIKIGLIILLVIILCVIPMSGNRRIMNIAIMTLMYIVLGQSWNILTGLTGLFSIAHALFFGLGVYGVSICCSVFQMPFYVGILMGMALSAFMAFVVGFISSKLSGLFFTMALIGLQTAVYSMAIQWFSLTGGATGIAMPKKYLLSREVLYLIALGMAICATLFFYWLRQSRTGTHFVALRENPSLALALGTNVAMYRVLAAVISALVASAAGAFYSFYMMSNNPEVLAGGISLKIIMVTIIGGAGELFGPVVGSVMIVIDELIRGWMPSKFASFSVVIYGVVLIVIALKQPGGLIKFFSHKYQTKIKNEKTK